MPISTPCSTRLRRYTRTGLGCLEVWEEVKQLPTSERKRISDAIDSWSERAAEDSPNSWRSLGVRSQLKSAADRKTFEGVAIEEDPAERIVDYTEAIHMAVLSPSRRSAARSG